MTNPSIEETRLTMRSGSTLKKQISQMLAQSSQCEAIFQCINHDTGEYKIVLHGVLDETLSNA